MCGSAPVVMRPVNDNDSDQNGAVVDEDEAAGGGHGSNRVALGDVWVLLSCGIFHIIYIIYIRYII